MNSFPLPQFWDTGAAMNGPRHNPVTPNRQLSESELRRLAAHVEQLDQFNVGGSCSFIDTGVGRVVIPLSGGSGSRRIPARLVARRTALGPPFPYSWIEQQEIGLARPGEYEDRLGGLTGTFTDMPTYDLNADQDSQAFDFTGDVVWLWLADFGTWYWFDGDEAGGSGPTGGDRFILNLSSFPDVNGRHEGRLMTENPDGTLTDPNPGGAGDVWLHDANNPGLLLGAAALHVAPPPTMTVGVIYKAKKTGYAAARDVYTLKDFTLYVRDDVDSRGLLGAQTLILAPYFSWDITFPVARSVQIVRKFDVKLVGQLIEGDIWEEDFRPSTNHWNIVRADRGRVTIDRNLVVRKEFVTFVGQSIWQIIFASGSMANLMWTVTNDLLGTVTVVRELNFKRGGFLAEARVWDVDCVPASNWTVTGSGFGSVVLQRVFNIFWGGVLFNTAHCWQQDFRPRHCWTITEPVPGSVTLERILRASLETNLVEPFVSELNFRGLSVQGQTWTIAQSVTLGRVDVWRNLDVREGAAIRSRDTWELIFDQTDFNIAIGATAGSAIIETDGFTGTVGPFYRYQCINEELRELTSVGFPTIHGLVKDNIATYS